MSQPAGGPEATGNGHREAGQAALDVVTEWQSSLSIKAVAFSAPRSTTDRE